MQTRNQMYELNESRNGHYPRQSMNRPWSFSEVSATIITAEVSTIVLSLIISLLVFALVVILYSIFEQHSTDQTTS